jgi:hypothetical protein
LGRDGHPLHDSALFTKQRSKRPENKSKTLADEIIKNIPIEVTTLANVIIVVYNTMVRISTEEELHGSKLIGRELNMFAKKNIFKTSKTRLKAAKKRLNLEMRGSDEEYAKHLNDILNEFKVLRERTEKCLLR